MIRDSSERDFIDALNRFRASQGLASVVAHPTVTAVAQAHAEDQAQRQVLTHGSGPQNMDTAADRLAAAGYTWSFSAENVAFGQRNAEELFDAWHGSEGHRVNMLAAPAVHYGFGMARNTLGPYWVLVLAAPM